MSVQQVPMSGFGVPPLPQSAQVNEHTSAANMQPGFVAPPAAPAPVPAAPPTAPAGSFTQADMDAAVAAALAGKTAAPGVLVAPSAGINTPAITNAAADPVLQSMTDLFTASATGVDMERALGKALAYGDADLIDVAYLNEKGGAQAANLVVIAKAIIGQVQSQARAGEAAVFSAAGGEPAWRVAAGVFDKSAPAHLKTVVKTMLDSGSSENMAAAAKMVVEYSVAAGGSVVRPGLVAAGAGGAGTAQALGKAEFQVLHAKLNTNAPDYTAQRGDLFVRRQLGKSLGL